MKENDRGASGFTVERQNANAPCAERAVAVEDELLGVFPEMTVRRTLGLPDPLVPLQRVEAAGSAPHGRGSALSSAVV